MYDVISNEHTTNCNFSSLKPLYTFSQARINGYSNFTRQAMTTEQRINLNFLVRLGNTPSDALGMLEVYGDETMSRSRFFEWHKRFKEKREDVEDDSRSERPSMSRTEDNVERVKQIVHGDRRLTVRMIADELEINRDSVWKIITEDLGMRKIRAKMTPKLLDDDQKERRVEVCQDILEHLQTEPDLPQRVITGDESWIFEYDLETKRQSLQWKCPSSPRPKKARQLRSKIKLMLIALFDGRGIVHMEFLPQGQTVNQHVYKEILRRLLRSVCEKRHELWQDNAPAHTALSIRHFLAERNVTVLDHPPYSPDPAPCDFFFSPSSRRSSRESVFQIWKPSRRP